MQQLLEGRKAVISALRRLKQEHCELGQPRLPKSKANKNSLIVGDKEVMALCIDKLPQEGVDEDLPLRKKA